MKKTILALSVQDIKQSMEFYMTKFGFTVRHHDTGFCIVVRNEVEIHLWKSGDESWTSKGASLMADPGILKLKDIVKPHDISPSKI